MPDFLVKNEEKSKIEIANKILAIGSFCVTLLCTIK